MHDRLDRTERRILGVLAEKELTTPHLYPLTLNALLNGCNQKNARDPVMQLQEFEVEGSLRHLFVTQWVTNSEGGSSRTTKWKHRLKDRLDVDGPALAVMTELLLRGPQTPGALRGHASRSEGISIPDLESLRAILHDLAAKDLVQEIPPEPGSRSRRWDHRLYPDEEAPLAAVETRETTPEQTQPALGTRQSEDLGERVARLEARLARIEGELGIASDEAGA